MPSGISLNTTGEQAQALDEQGEVKAPPQFWLTVGHCHRALAEALQKELDEAEKTTTRGRKSKFRTSLLAAPCNPLKPSLTLYATIAPCNSL